ncbi:30S ribosomal protein S6 [Egibacter rhizosphaerae]|uniref:Small ribosomal subunit protein bS6 n=1 Tax=Egibacter rhizosphaerae TaxID=1670831 RepID=A0A411YFK8_9ACTN|nr:30S ribosomal protein S6 [Egibacter rhizosphaerae]QBI20044.1 30S ribosomal protein S6 [Egibacter rhizosphaerae]
MHTYELMIISHGSLAEDTVQSVIDRFQKLVGDLGGSVDRVDHWGKREFAYEIDHMREGYYTVLDIQLPGDQLAELERQLHIADEVVRHKAIRPDLRTKKVG